MSCILCILAYLKRSQLSYSKGTSWELCCNYNVAHHFLQYGTDSFVFDDWINVKARRWKSKLWRKKAHMIIYCDFDNPTYPLQNPSSFWSRSFVVDIQLLSDISRLENLQCVCFLFFFSLFFFLISPCQKCLALSKNCRRALWHFLLLQTSAVETRLVQGLM